MIRNYDGYLYIERTPFFKHPVGVYLNNRVVWIKKKSRPTFPSVSFLE